MGYTKTELRNAFCEARNYNANTDGTKIEFINAQLAIFQQLTDKQRAAIDEPKDIAKRIALDYLLKQEKEANKNVSFE